MTDRHVEKAPLERIPAETRDRTNIHMEVRARILAECKDYSISVDQYWYNIDVL